MILLFSILFGVGQVQSEEPVELLELFNNQPVRHEVHSGAEKRFEALSSAVVEIRNPYGYGTGTVVKYDSQVFVITAAHVVRGFDSVQVISESQNISASIAYSDAQADLAILSLSQEIEVRPLKLKPRRSPARIGEELAYCGYPNRTDVACFKGSVSITGDSFVNLHSYAWKGASGSLVVDSRGRAVGVVSAVEVGHFLGMPALIEDIVWIKPLSDEFYEAIEGL